MLSPGWVLVCFVSAYVRSVADEKRRKGSFNPHGQKRLDKGSLPVGARQLEADLGNTYPCCCKLFSFEVEVEIMITNGRCCDARSGFMMWCTFVRCACIPLTCIPPCTFSTWLVFQFQNLYVSLFLGLFGLFVWVVRRLFLSSNWVFQVDGNHRVLACQESPDSAELLKKRVNVDVYYGDFLLMFKAFGKSPLRFFSILRHFRSRVCLVSNCGNWYVYVL